MTAQPLGYEVIFDENGKPQFSEDAAARLRSRLGHDPAPGETLTLVDPLDAADDMLPEMASDGVMERFLGTVAVKTFHEMDAHPERNLSVEQVLANLAAARAKRAAG